MAVGRIYRATFAAAVSALSAVMKALVPSGPGAATAAGKKYLIVP